MSKERLGYARGMLAAPSGDGDLVFTASAEGVNRYGFSLNPKRWKFDNFNANPVILWMHMDHMPPIGRGRASLDSGGLKTSVQFDRNDPFAVTIENKYRTGFLNAVSVGFDFVEQDGTPIDRWWNMDAEKMANAYYDLAEVSAVPVPADPQALIRQRHALAFDMGLSAADDVEEAIRLLSLPPSMLGALRGVQGRPEPPEPPALPGNSTIEQRLARLEEMITKLAAPVGEPKPPADPDPAEEEFDPKITQDFLSAIKL